MLFVCIDRDHISIITQSDLDSTHVSSDMHAVEEYSYLYILSEQGTLYMSHDCLANHAVLPFVIEELIEEKYILK